MKIHNKFFLLSILMILFLLAGSSSTIRCQDLQTYQNRLILPEIIENFDDGTIELFSYPGEDQHPYAWSLDSQNTYNNSPYSLKLYGNTWKIENIDSITVDSGDVWQVSAHIQSLGEIQGFGITDFQHTLLYSFAGTEELNIDEWVTVYQGAFPVNTWNIYQLPIADDWLDRYQYLPTITGLIFVNDRDQDPTAVVYFDEIINITQDLPFAPQVEISYTMSEIYRNSFGKRSVDVQFQSEVYDPDSYSHSYFWYFGDDSISSEPNPFHTFLVEDDHLYNVLLEVVDSTQQWGRASCQIQVDPGPTTFPVTMNFVGDIMLARRYEQPGGIIPTQGVEAIFQPTLPFLGNAADITVANMECPLANYGTPHPTKTIIFKSSPTNVAGLVYAGIDVVSLANNHIIDYGLEGLQQTQTVLNTNNIIFSGAGANAYEAYLPAFYSKSGITIAFLASSDRTGQYNNYQPYLDAGFNKPGFANITPYYIAQQIAAVRNEADLVVVEMHSGSEYSFSPNVFNHIDIYENLDGDEDFAPTFSTPNRQDIEIRRSVIDAGADVVICHHPHIIQGFEVYNGKLIAHSLGNFVFDLDYTETLPSFILNGKIDQSGFYECSVTPVFIDDYIPVRAKGELGLHILDYLARQSREMETYLSVDRNEVIGKILLDSLAITPNEYTHEKTFLLQEKNGNWISAPIHLPRNGSISEISSIMPSSQWQYRLGREIVWFGNFEDEGCTLWEIDHSDEWYDSTEAYAGARSLRHRRPAGFTILNTNFENRLMCYSDTSYYTLHGYIKTQNANDASVKIRFYDSRTSPYFLAEDNIGIEIDGDTDWKFYYNELDPPSGTQFIDIILRSVSPQSGEGYSWFDNVGLVEWSDWQPFTGEQIITNPNDYYWLQVKTTTEILRAKVSFKETHYSEIITDLKDDKIVREDAFELYQNYPNPFNPTTNIRYDLSISSKVILKIYNILGQEIRTLVDKMELKGPKTIFWDGRDNHRKVVSSGVYVYRLQAADRVQSKKMILLR